MKRDSHIELPLNEPDPIIRWSHYAIRFAVKLLAILMVMNHRRTRRANSLTCAHRQPALLDLRSGPLADLPLPDDLHPE